jgi:Zn-dependent protease
MFDVTIQQLLYRAFAFAIIVGMHGWAVASTARLLGDRGPLHDDRATANPVPHTDVLGLITALLFRTGWMRPLALEGRPGARGAAERLLAALGGLIATLALALAVRALRPSLFGWLPTSASIPALAFADTLIVMSLRFVALNLIPAPPLSLGHVWRRPSGREGARIFTAITWGVRALLVAALASGVAASALGPVERLLARLIRFA